MKNKIEILDTTLRDGAQGVGIEFSPDDKVKVIHALDSLGVTYIEVGMISGEREAAALSKLGEIKTENSRLAVLARTCKPMEKAEDSSFLKLLSTHPIPVVTVFGKASASQVKSVLGTTNEENLRMIGDSIRYLVSAGKEVIFDAEHFFDGCLQNEDYSMSVVKTAFEAGAVCAVLCDTNGATLPWRIAELVEKAVSLFPGKKIGIHCHNDTGTADAATASAVNAGAVHAQGTMLGIGERCGNSNLSTVIPLLQLRMGYDCVGEKISLLTEVSHKVASAGNLTLDERLPFVGGYAFAHKAGTHIDAVLKSTDNFEHVSPETVGNRRHLLLSSLAGRAAVIRKLEKLSPGTHFDKNDPQVLSTVELIRHREAEGYSYDDASASLELLIDEALKKRGKFFDLLDLKVIVNESPESIPFGKESFTASAVIKISVDGCVELSAGEGNGPVNAIDEALRRALTRFYPELEKIRLTDYRVRVLDSRATASSVRVSIESSDDEFVWRTVGVSSDVINASWQALRDSVEFKLKKSRQAEVGDK